MLPMRRPGAEFNGDMVGRPPDDVEDGIYYPDFSRDWEDTNKKNKPPKSPESPPKGATHFIPSHHLFYPYPPSNNERFDIAYKAGQPVYVRNGQRRKDPGGGVYYLASVVVGPNQPEILATSFNGAQQCNLYNGHPICVPPTNYIKIKTE